MPCLQAQGMRVCNEGIKFKKGAIKCLFSTTRQVKLQYTKTSIQYYDEISLGKGCICLQVGLSHCCKKRKNFLPNTKLVLKIRPKKHPKAGWNTQKISTSKRVLCICLLVKISNRKGEGRFCFYVPQVTFGHGMALIRAIPAHQNLSQWRGSPSNKQLNSYMCMLRTYSKNS